MRPEHEEICRRAGLIRSREGWTASYWTVSEGVLEALFENVAYEEIPKYLVAWESSLDLLAPIIRGQTNWSKAADDNEALKNHVISRIAKDLGCLWPVMLESGNSI